MGQTREVELRQHLHQVLGLAGGAVICAALALLGSPWLFWPSAGLVMSAAAVAWRITGRQRYGYWVAWAAGTAVSLILCRTAPDTRWMQEPITVVLAAGAVILFGLWRSALRR
ncbi:hypothetical protein P3T35_000411 [Kitasatospora sp. GP30]|uniref:hypothetical protein n=1 Tax=Kitasatospora sp. GP30 TaxID=3035084 RepID=UPI000CC571B1|nr:hypothetical protein [Kitasatospora sp. GP30]MDH6138434.1 hypothetical protein [Kitasatospora sp. GP30]